MLNCDYKIIARVLNRRLTPLMPKLLHSSQVGPGTVRDISTSLCEIREVLSHHEATQQPAALVSLDLQCAFDLVHHTYLFEVLRKLGIPTQFVAWLRCLYEGAHSRIEVNGYLSHPFPIGRSVRQGGPESMTLFCLAMRPLVAEFARVLRPTVVRGVPFNISNYVDDTQLLLTDQAQGPDVTTTLARFSGASGLVVNYAKTKALVLGGLQPQDVGLPVTQVSSTRILGVVFSPSIKELPALNWPSAIAAAGAVLRETHHRSFCLEQRVRYCNTYALSKLWYLAKVVPPHAGPLTRIRVHVASLVWDGWFFRVPYPVLCLPIGEGGFGLHDALLRSQALYFAKWHSLRLEQPTTFAAAALEALLVDHPHTQPLPPIARSKEHLRTYLTTLRLLPAALSAAGQALIHLVYSTLLAGKLPPSIRVTTTLPNTNWEQVWTMIGSRFLTMRARSVWFSAVHDIWATNDRLFRIQRSDCDRCSRCGRLDTVLHRITTCGEAESVWAWLKGKVESIAGVTVSQDFVIRPDTILTDRKKSNAIAWITGFTVCAVLSEPSSPPLADITHTIQQHLRYVIYRGERYIKHNYGTHLVGILQ
jgi:hypothetical protein